MIEDPSPVGAVRRFAAALCEVRTRLLADLSPIEDIADLQAAVRSRRELPRQDVTSSGIEYTVHGAGCSMVASDGREVDVDVIPDPALGDGVEAFDAWRIRRFLDKADQAACSDEEINSACVSLARDGYLREVVDGRWYALADHSHPSVS
ncbi:hypothetical protein V6V47_28560 [Micromonospora sp. CPCC 205539]|uniref:DUF6896 domain-containing protein n=1 Tax=Micromonospora sp. CPCC 205539 TaxID=3122408 RepID=UPI002FF19745